MAIGIVNDELFESELNIATHQNHTIGRGNKKETPEVIREIIAEEAIAGVPAKEISETFGISQSSISAYKNGATSTSSYHKPDHELKKKNDEFRDKIIGTARRRLLMALKSIDEEALKGIKPRDAAGIAKDMSTVINNISPNHSGPAINQANFIFHSYPNKHESEYDVIDVVGQ